MKTWRFGVIGEKIRRADSDAPSAYSLQAERAALRTNGTMQLTYQLWNGQPQLSRTGASSIKDEHDKMLADFLAWAPEMDAKDLSRVMTKLEVDAQAHEPTGKADPGDDAPEEQLSLCPPGSVCVALNAASERVYVVRNSDGTLDIAPTMVGPYKGHAVMHRPPPDLPWTLPHAENILHHHRAAHSPGWAARLLADLEAYHRQASDLGRPEAYLLVALYVMTTYVVEHVDYLAIIVLEAEPERGKTRTGQAIAAVCLHGMHLQGIREANLLRAAGNLRATLFIGLMNAWETAKREKCEDVILGRWERGGYVERVNNPDAGPFADTVRYSVFGPTVIATNEPIERILGTRALRIDMPFSTQRFSGRIRPEDAVPLVERLMAWRALMLGGELPECDPPADGRLGDILRPMRLVLQVVDQSRESEFSTIVKWQIERRGDDLAQTWEAGVISAVKSRSLEVDNGYLAISSVLDVFNLTQPENRKRTARWLGGKLRNLGWTIERVGHDNVRSLVWDDALLERLCRRYGLIDSASSAGAPSPSSNGSHGSHGSHDAQNSPKSATRATQGATDTACADGNRSQNDDVFTRDATDATDATGRATGVQMDGLVVHGNEDGAEWF